MANVTTPAERVRLEQHVQEVRRQSLHQIRLRKLVAGVLGIMVFLLVWEIAPRVVEGVNILMFPPPSVVAKTFWSMTTSGEIWPHMLASLYRILIGFVVGATTGVLVGVVTGSSALARYVSDPILHGLRAIPVIAIVPLAIVWLGLGDIAKIVLIAWGVFFPVWVNTFIGIRSVSILYLRSATSMGANALQLMFLVALPAALPYVFAGLRQATSLAFVVMVAAELAGAEVGLGFLISYSHLVFRIDMMFVGLIYLGALGFLADQFFVAMLHKFFPWYEERR